MPDAPRWDAVRLVGPGFVLRRWRADDLDALLHHADDPLLVRGLSERFPYPYTRADGARFLAGRVVDLIQPVLAIEIDGVACGSIGVRHDPSGERAHSAELGYWLGRAHWNRGVMRQVVARYVPWVMEALALVRLQAQVLDSNPASARVLQLNGFVEEGRLRGAIRKADGLHDLRVFGLLRGAAGS
ncbi:MULTISPECIES: GNAT family protein [Luteimonas]|uniref:GNAT family N-acetyltransferase n=1 Tax=Luteimonas chenhongjianii TaxID=2006110 RepID=A0A290XID0_9GAMM|nr:MULTISPECIES: GNAT family protein [Luteimonas]ATD68905.1 GNAT family N-acetyltransferase [Luteimonas chenhongjianii]RPD87923.1 N-acetyltransferase [Luteimonas sp. 100069]